MKLRLPRFAFGRRVGLPVPLVMVLVSALALSGCGLETVEYISAPAFYPVGGFLVLKDMASAGTNPRDFEILYRIYESQSDATTALNNINTLVASNSSSPASVYSQLINGSLNLRHLLFSFSDPSANPDPSILQLAPSQQGVNSYFQIGTPNSANWTVEEFVGSSGGTFNDKGQIASQVYRNTISPNVQNTIYQISLIGSAASDIDYTPDSTIANSSSQYPPPSGKAYLLLVAVAKSTSDFINYTYSMPTPLAYGLVLLPDGTQPQAAQ